MRTRRHARHMLIALGALLPAATGLSVATAGAPRHLSTFSSGGVVRVGNGAAVRLPHSAGHATSVATAVGSDGTIYAVYRVDTAPKPGFHGSVYFTQRSVSGPWTAPFRLTKNSTIGHARGLAISVLNGTVLVAWNDFNTAQYSMRAAGSSTWTRPHYAIALKAAATPYDVAVDPLGHPQVLVIDASGTYVAPRLYVYGENAAGADSDVELPAIGVVGSAAMTVDPSNHNAVIAALYTHRNQPSSVRLAIGEFNLLTQSFTGWHRVAKLPTDRPQDAMGNVSVASDGGQITIAAELHGDDSNHRAATEGRGYLVTGTLSGTGHVVRMPSKYLTNLEVSASTSGKGEVVWAQTNPRHRASRQGVFVAPITVASDSVKVGTARQVATTKFALLDSLSVTGNGMPVVSFGPLAHYTQHVT